MNMRPYRYLFLLIWWLAGIVLAKGFLPTVTAICIFPYAWYLVVEKIMVSMGWV